MRRRTIGVAVLLAAWGVGLAITAMGESGAPPGAQRGRRFILGRSVRGRPIRAVELGSRSGALRLLVFGCIHGDETAGIAVARDLLTRSVPSGVDLWVVDDLNPDGVAAGTRQNARGVDLNRNFPYLWRSLAPPGDVHYAGPSALSEPESRLAWGLIRRLRPAITIWYHQPLRGVDLSGGRLATERRYARLAGLPARRLPRYPGSATGWQDHRFPGGTAFVVELAAGRLAPRRAARQADAVLGLARWELARRAHR